MHSRVPALLFSAVVIVPGVAGPGCCLAAPDEIQVYQDELKPAGEAALELNVNYAATGPDQPPEHPGPRARCTGFG